MAKPHGQIRQSQIVTTFGPGAMVDLPNHSIIIGGLDHWSRERKRIVEERLEARICEILDLREVAMYAPPVDSGDPAAPQTGITAFTFPTWFIAQHEEPWREPFGKEYRSRPLVHWKKLERGMYIAPNRRRVPVVPVRFVQACVNGHIGDIDWYAFVHSEANRDCRGQLWLEEGGTGGDIADIFVRCAACHDRRTLANAKLPRGGVLGRCEGRRPWLGPHAREECQSRTQGGGAEFNRLLIRSASNAYFAQVLSVISIPDKDDQIRKAVDPIWEDELKYVEDLDELKRLRRKGKPKITAQLEGWSDDDVWAEIERRRRPHDDTVRKNIKQAEIETLLASTHDDGDDVPEQDFYARARSPLGLDSTFAERVLRIVLVHRLREVQAQIGFTRFEAIMPDVDGELALDVQRAALAMEPTWVPAIENRGEGVFVAFRQDAIAAWLERPAVKRRGDQLAEGFGAWCRSKGLRDAKFPGLPFIMLHTLSHLLLTAVSLECGYAASAIRERVYAGSSGYGILLYTGTPGSEGTLGGLVEVGKRLEHHLAIALETGRLCSNDPVCAQHRSDDPHEERFLHGAACHGCLLIAESSCERRNELLDRALVVPTVEDRGAEFFWEPE